MEFIALIDDATGKQQHFGLAKNGFITVTDGHGEELEHRSMSAYAGAEAIRVLRVERAELWTKRFLFDGCTLPELAARSGLRIAA